MSKKYSAIILSSTIISCISIIVLCIFLLNKPVEKNIEEQEATKETSTSNSSYVTTIDNIKLEVAVDSTVIPDEEKDIPEYAYEYVYSNSTSIFNDLFNTEVSVSVYSVYLSESSCDVVMQCDNSDTGILYTIPLDGTIQDIIVDSASNIKGSDYSKIYFKYGVPDNSSDIYNTLLSNKIRGTFATEYKDGNEVTLKNTVTEDVITFTIQGGN